MSNTDGGINTPPVLVPPADQTPSASLASASLAPRFGFCYACNQSVNINPQDFSCTVCNGGFVELTESHSISNRPTSDLSSSLRFTGSLPHSTNSDPYSYRPILTSINHPILRILQRINSHHHHHHHHHRSSSSSLMVENTDDNNDMIQISDNESPSEFDSDVASLTSANSGSTDRAYSSIRTRLRHRAQTESDLEAMAAASLSSRRPATTSQQTTEDEAINLASSISYPTSVGGEASGGMPTIRDRFDYWFSEPHRSRIHSSHEQGLSAANGRSSSATSDGSSLTTENVLSSVATGRTAYTNIFPSHVQGQVEWDREQIARAQQAERDRNRLLRDHDRDRPRVFSSTRELDFASNASTREPFRIRFREMSGSLPHRDLYDEDNFFNEHSAIIISTLLNQFRNRGVAPATETDIQNLDAKKIDQEVIDNGSQCAICMDEFEIETTVKQLPCKHLFHEPCIAQWLKIHATCPVCRKNIRGEAATEAETNAQPTTEATNPFGSILSPALNLFNVIPLGRHVDGGVSISARLVTHPRASSTGAGGSRSTASTTTTATDAVAESERWRRRRDYMRGLRSSYYDDYEQHPHPHSHSRSAAISEPATTTATTSTGNNSTATRRPTIVTHYSLRPSTTGRNSNNSDAQLRPPSSRHSYMSPLPPPPPPPSSTTYPPYYHRAERRPYNRMSSSYSSSLSTADIDHPSAESRPPRPQPPLPPPTPHFPSTHHQRSATVVGLGASGARASYFNPQLADGNSTTSDPNLNRYLDLRASREHSPHLSVSRRYHQERAAASSVPSNIPAFTGISLPHPLFTDSRLDRAMESIAASGNSEALRDGSASASLPTASRSALRLPQTSHHHHAARIRIVTVGSRPVSEAARGGGRNINDSALVNYLINRLSGVDRDNRRASFNTSFATATSSNTGVGSWVDAGSDPRIFSFVTSRNPSSNNSITTTQPTESALTVPVICQRRRPREPQAGPASTSARRENQDFENLSNTSTITSDSEQDDDLLNESVIMLGSDFESVDSMANASASQQNVNIEIDSLVADDDEDDRVMNASSRAKRRRTSFE